jgi:hypothetical protein
VTFSEFVQESNLPQAVVITPIPAHPPEYSWSGRRVTIEFQDPLVENRTYAVTFGGEISDLSGNRLGRPFTLRFATGPVIDSGRIQGSVLGMNKRRAFVFAYRIPSDSARFSDTLRPDSTRPDFITPVGDDGRFSLEGLPNGTFRLLAVADETADQIYTPGSDAYGVATTDFRIDTATVPVTGVVIRLRPGAIDIVAPALYSASSVNRSHTTLRFSEPIDTATVRRENFSITLDSGGTATITDVWRSPTNRLAVEIAHSELPAEATATAHAVNLRDTVGNGLPDSAASAKFTVADRHDTLPPNLLPLAIDSIKAYSFPDSIVISFDEGVRVTNPAGMVSIRDTAGPRIPFRLRPLNGAQFVATPLDSLFGVTRAMLEIDLGRVSDLSGNRRDSVVKLPVAIAQPRLPGSLQGTIADSIAPGSLHVVIAQMTGTGRIFRLRGVRNGPWEFPSLPEGEYEVSAFRDNDNDGEYDYGSPVPFRPAEAFTAFRGSVRVRPRWATNKVDLVFKRSE